MLNCFSTKVSVDLKMEERLMSRNWRVPKTKRKRRMLRLQFPALQDADAISPTVAEKKLWKDDSPRNKLRRKLRITTAKVCSFGNGNDNGFR